MSSRGWLTIHNEFSSLWGFEVGDRLIFEIDEQTVVVKEVKPVKISALNLFGTLSKPVFET